MASLLLSVTLARTWRKQLREKSCFHLNLKMLWNLFLTVKFLPCGRSRVIPHWSHSEDTLLILSSALNSSKLGLTRVYLPSTGLISSTSHKVSWLEQFRTMLVNMESQSMVLYSISKLFKKRILLLQKMVSTSKVCTSKDASGTIRGDVSTRVTLRFSSSRPLWYGSNRA